MEEKKSIRAGHGVCRGVCPYPGQHNVVQPVAGQAG